MPPNVHNKLLRVRATVEDDLFRRSSRVITDWNQRARFGLLVQLCDRQPQDQGNIRKAAIVYSEPVQDLVADVNGIMPKLRFGCCGFKPAKMAKTRRLRARPV